MSSSEEQSSLFSEFFEDDSSGGEYNEHTVIGLYSNKPEYTETDMHSKHLSSSEDSDYSEECDSSRLEKLHWCPCRVCAIGFTMQLEEAKCRRETSELLREKFDWAKCITQNKDFQVLFLNRTVCETACICHLI